MSHRRKKLTNRQQRVNFQTSLDVISNRSGKWDFGTARCAYAISIKFPKPNKDSSPQMAMNPPRDFFQKLTGWRPVHPVIEDALIRRFFWESGLWRLREAWAGASIGTDVRLAQPPIQDQPLAKPSRHEFTLPPCIWPVIRQACRGRSFWEPGDDRDGRAERHLQGHPRRGAAKGAGAVFRPHCIVGLSARSASGIDSENPAAQASQDMQAARLASDFCSRGRGTRCPAIAKRPVELLGGSEKCGVCRAGPERIRGRAERSSLSLGPVGAQFPGSQRP